MGTALGVKGWGSTEQVWEEAGSQLGWNRGLVRGVEGQGKPHGESFLGQAERSGLVGEAGWGWGEEGPLCPLARVLQAEAPPPTSPFHSHKAGFVSIYLLDFSAKMLLEKHIALI